VQKHDKRFVPHNRFVLWSTSALGACCRGKACVEGVIHSSHTIAANQLNGRDTAHALNACWLHGNNP